MKFSLKKDFSNIPLIAVTCVAAAFLALYSSVYLSPPAIPVSQTATQNVIQTGAQAHILIDAKSGEVLSAHNADARLPMASTTKIMTAIIVIENAAPDEIVAVSREASMVEGSSCYLVEGEHISVLDLLYGLMLESGNDAAHALAEHIAGDTESFARMMNKKAAELGLKNTHFENPHGLYTEGHYTSAHDLAEIAAYAMENELFRTIAATKTYKTSPTDKSPERYFSNHHRLLRSLPFCTGIKTGYTKLAGRCLVSSCEKDGSRFISVTLNDRSDWADHTRLLSFAMSHFKTVTLAEKGEIFFYPDSSQKIINSEDILITLPISFDGTFELSFDRADGLFRMSAKDGGPEKTAAFTSDTVIVPQSAK